MATKAQRVQKLNEISRARPGVVSSQQVYNANAEGLISRGADGLFDVDEAIEAIQEKANRTKGGGTKGSPHQEEYWKIKVEILKLTYEKEKGELVNLSEYKQDTIRRELIFRDRILSMPRELAFQLYRLKPKEIEAKLRSHCEEILRALAYKFQKEADRIRANNNGKEKNGHALRT